MTTYSAQSIFKKLWSIISIGGIIGILFGLSAIIWPSTVLSIFIYLFSAVILAISIVVLGQALANIRVDGLWWLSMIFAICGISVALFIILNPRYVEGIIAVLFAVYIFSQSLMDIVAASYSDDKGARTPTVILGIISIILGFAVLFYPKLATTTLMWVIGVYALAHGIIIEYCTIRARRQLANMDQALNEVNGDTDHSSKTSKLHTKRKRAKKSDHKTEA